jgi:hypothetical protein
MRYASLAAAVAVALASSTLLSQELGAGNGTTLATVSIPQLVLASGKPLAAGLYELRLTGEWFQPLGGGQQGMQWVEFLSNGKVAGRELALVIPSREIGAVSEWHPADGATRLDLLQSGDFVRIWTNRGKANYLIHLPVQ